MLVDVISSENRSLCHWIGFQCNGNYIIQCVTYPLEKKCVDPTDFVSSVLQIMPYRYMYMHFCEMTYWYQSQSVHISWRLDGIIRYASANCHKYMVRLLLFCSCSENLNSLNLLHIHMPSSFSWVCKRSFNTLGTRRQAMVLYYELLARAFPITSPKAEVFWKLFTSECEASHNRQIKASCNIYDRWKSIVVSQNLVQLWHFFSLWLFLKSCTGHGCITAMLYTYFTKLGKKWLT